MALRDAVADLVSQMEEDIKAHEAEAHYDAAQSLRMYARLLSMALKASEGEQAPSRQALLPSQIEGEIMARAREEARAARHRKEAAEGVANATENLVECVGGELDGTWVPLPAEAPVGAKTGVGGGVYVLEVDRKLHYSQAETVKVAGNGQQIIPG